MTQLKSKGFIVIALVVVVISSLALAQDPPSTIKIDRIENLYKASNFDHKGHVEVSDSCKTCHHTYKKGAGPVKPCFDCHKAEVDENNPEMIGYKGALHLQCMGCHKENGIDNSCVSCHEKK